MCGDKPLQMVTCLAGDWDQDVDSDPHRFACPIRVTPEEAPADTSWLPFMIGCVSGVTIISFCITLFMLYRANRKQKKLPDNFNHQISIKSDSLGMETRA